MILQGNFFFFFGQEGKGVEGWVVGMGKGKGVFL